MKVVLAAWLAVGVAGAQTGRTVQVQVLAINDLHGFLEPPAGRDGLVGTVPAGGIEYLATHLKMAEKDGPSIVVGAGDLFGASPLLSAFFQEAPTIEAVNALGMSVTSIGNHEMDHGVTELKRRLRAAKWEYLAGNVLQDGRPIFAATAVRTVGGVKIGFIGVTLVDSPKVIAAQAIVGDTFLEESGVANAAAARLERQGVHAIVLLIHQGGAQHAAGDAGLDVNGCAGFSGPIVGIVEKLSPAIGVVVSGHSHQFYNCQIAGHTVTSAGAYGRLFTRVRLTVDRRTDRVVGVVATNEIVSRDVAKDAAETAILAKYKPREEAVAGKVVGRIAGEIVRKQNAAGESALGDVIADAQLAGAPGAEVAFMNESGIRADLVGPGRAVTYGDLYAVQPFGNKLTLATMTGEQLRRVLEQQFREGGGASILQVSDGFTYQYRKDAAAGEHVVPGSIRLRGRVVQDGDKVRVEASDFLMAGGDGMTVFKEATDRVVGAVDVDALVAWFGGRTVVAAGGMGRIVRVD